MSVSILQSIESISLLFHSVNMALIDANPDPEAVAAMITAIPRILRQSHQLVRRHIKVSRHSRGVTTPLLRWLGLIFLDVGHHSLLFIHLNHLAHPIHRRVLHLLHLAFHQRIIIVMPDRYVPTDAHLLLVKPDPALAQVAEVA